MIPYWLDAHAWVLPFTNEHARMVWKLPLFLVASISLVEVSRKSLRQPRSHGFTRFFAWEAILLLFLLNVENWFVDPLAWNQLVAWVLLTACIIPVVWGTLLLHRHGKPSKQRDTDTTLLAFEKTSRLVTTGIYGYIRHPLYCSLLLFTWGIFFKQPSWLGGSLGIAATGMLFLTALRDEAECSRFFGKEYDAYKRVTRRFIPYLL